MNPYPFDRLSDGDISLLVSVRSGPEYAIAAQAGVSIVDLKEPRRGALHPTTVGLWREVASKWRQSDRRRSHVLSAALGEADGCLRVAEHLPGEFRFAKAGPSQMSEGPQLLVLWQRLIQRLPATTELVAVGYADHHQAGCCDPLQVLRLASQAGLRRCLIDTFTKDGRNTVDHLGVRGLQHLADLARELGLWWALAGSMTAQSVRELIDQGIVPDCVGVRGAVCDDGRGGMITRKRIDDFSDAALRAFDQSAAGH